MLKTRGLNSFRQSLSFLAGFKSFGSWVTFVWKMIHWNQNKRFFVWLQVQNKLKKKGGCFIVRKSMLPLLLMTSRNWNYLKYHSFQWKLRYRGSKKGTLNANPKSAPFLEIFSLWWNFRLKSVKQILRLFLCFHKLL